MKSFILILFLFLSTSSNTMFSNGIISFNLNIEELERCCGDDLDGDWVVTVYDLSGKVIGTFKVKKDGSNGYKIDLNSNELGKGFYMINICNPKTGKSLNKKFNIF